MGKRGGRRATSGTKNNKRPPKASNPSAIKIKKPHVSTLAKRLARTPRVRARRFLVAPKVWTTEQTKRIGVKKGSRPLVPVGTPSRETVARQERAKGVKKNVVNTSLSKTGTLRLKLNALRRKQCVKKPDSAKAGQIRQSGSGVKTKYEFRRWCNAN